MVSDLSILAGRVRDFIASCEVEFSKAQLDHSAFRPHADAEFNDLALRLFALQFQCNAAYRKLCEARGLLPGAIHHWSGIPAVPTSAFKEWEMTSLVPGERTQTFHSSGTSGTKPSRHFHSAESLHLYRASALTWFRAQFPTRTELAILTPPPVLAPHSSLVHMLDLVRLDWGAAEDRFLGFLSDDRSWALDLEAAVQVLDLASRRKERITVLGTAFSFVHLMDYLASKNLMFQLPCDSRVMETGGYKNRSRELPKPELHRLIEQRLGISQTGIDCEYGMSELSSQAYDTAANQGAADPSLPRHFKLPPWARAQIISTETGHPVADGETGLIRVWDLANVFSVMVIQTEDLAVRRGDRFELLGRSTASEPRGCSLLSQETELAIRLS